MHDANAQKVSWFELFYDLIVVAAVSQAGKVLVKSPDWETTALIAAGILVLFTMWLLTTLSHGLFPGDDPVRRVLVLVQMFALIVGAMAVGKLGLPNWVGFTALAVAFLSLVGVYALHGREDATTTRISRRMALSLLAAAAAFAASAVVATTLSSDEAAVVAPVLLLVGILVVVVPLVGPFLRTVVGAGRLDLEHLEERFGLLTIIVLGESFISLVATLGSKGKVPSPFFFVLAFLVAYCIWSVYFSSVLPSGMPGSVGGVRGWVATHLLLVFGMVAVAAELTDLTLTPFRDQVPSDHGTWSPLPLLTVLIAIALLTKAARRTSAAMLAVHLVAVAVVLLLTVVDALGHAPSLPWTVAVAALVVVVDAGACSVIKQREDAERDAEHAEALPIA